MIIQSARIGVMTTFFERCTRKWTDDFCKATQEKMDTTGWLRLGYECFVEKDDQSDDDILSEMRQAHRNKNVSKKELIRDAVDLLEDAIVYKWNNPNK